MSIELTLKTSNAEKILFNVKHIVAVVPWTQYDNAVIGSAIHVSNDTTPFHVTETYDEIVTMLKTPTLITN